ncbi:polymerase [Lone star tick rhabdovirus]|uniref:Replicase n=1 Tax=Lone star tick rhabdovirus TaxID=1756186 RepID=A0A1L2A161_9RHAB|nr:polymerase [Lone star tick rhabdovirus]ALO28655.1 polymerase [Lone star tick rhabdovirus]
MAVIHPTDHHQQLHEKNNNKSNTYLIIEIMLELEYSEPLEDLIETLDSYEYSLLEDGSYVSSEVYTSGFISQDYNLNSPLLPDETDALYKYLTNKSTDPRYNHRKSEWELIEKGLIRLNYDMSKLHSSSSNHQSMIDILTLDRDSVLRIDVIKRWKDCWDQSKDPSNTTIKHITNSPNLEYPNYRKRFHLLTDPPPTLMPLQNEWKIFLEAHFITHLMNSNLTHQSRSWVSKIFYTKTSQKLNHALITLIGQTKSSIKWIVTTNYTLHLETGSIFTKDFILMIKDITLARCMSLLSLTYRGDRTDNLADAVKLRKIYDAGDTIVREYGNDSYKILKLIEAEATEQWNMLGSKYRPKIPKSDSLLQHLEETYTEGDWDQHIIRPFILCIRTEDDPWMVGQIYGTFRHWGHPYINYLKGLKELEARVNENIKIDRKYASTLASDLAYLVLKHQFQKKKIWYASSQGLPAKSPLKDCIDKGVWPTTKVIEDFGDNWHRLKLLPCFDVPDTIDMTDLYSDKAHSMDRPQVLDHIKNNPYRPIPGRRVMDTLLTEQNPNIPQFLKEINDLGIEQNSLIIGLKAKERELKDKGRFFSLMSWKLRLYFVVTEYLIKTYYVPLFSGLTMADDLTTVTKKLLTATIGQGTNSYDKIYIANSLDYDKWNNRQRLESNSAVFKVMGLFLGYPNIFVRTHEFFENSLIYYNDRPDLMTVRGQVVSNRNPDKVVTWNGQLGGFEGLRQKGWSVLNYLVLRREALTRNTKTKFLAQGDNQIVITQYSYMGDRSDTHLDREILNIWENNQDIMRRIQTATQKLGLLINEDEVVTSSELLIYGKIPVFRGKVIPLETKRWSRISAVTNDQLPSFSNSIASATTSALAVCQYSDSPIEVIYQHHFFTSFVFSLLSWINAILGYDPLNYNQKDPTTLKKIVIRSLYKDPSVGGVCGTNLLRFFISRFPDPVCESLSWWKILYHNSTDKIVKSIALEVGNPQLGEVNSLTRSMLLEDPTTLNIPGGLSSDTVIKNKIFEGLLDRVHDGYIKNTLVKESLIYTDTYKERFVTWLFKINPIFPRFLSEFFTSTYFRITESIISIFQNSRTIRKAFSRSFPKEIYEIIVKGEHISINCLIKPRTGQLSEKIWTCSASHSDKLRSQSWGPNITGVTTPHPSEFLVESLCELSCEGQHIVAKKIKLEDRQQWTKGPLMPYLGSKTKESTSVIQPWEKHIEVPLLKRACDLRKTINWFIMPQSNLASSIYLNLHSLTGLDLSEELTDYKRTGSSKHRLRCSRVSNEGNPSIGYNNLTYVTVTTDSLGDINEDNYDFMYQSLLCWCGVLSSLPENIWANCDPTHYHIKDIKCLRPVKEDILESPSVFCFPDKSKNVKAMLSQNIEMKYLPRYTPHITTDWDLFSDGDKSWHIGRAQGFLWGLANYMDTLEEEAQVLFPTTIMRKVHPIPYMHGLHRGFSLGATLTPCFTRYGSLSEKARLKFEGCYWKLIESALLKSNLPNIINHLSFKSFLERTGSDIIKSYPATRLELTEVIRRWFLRRLIAERHQDNHWKAIPVVVFADMNTEYIIGMFRISESIYSVFQHEKLSATDLQRLSNATKTMKLLSEYNDSKIEPTQIKRLSNTFKSPAYPKYQIVTSETRHAAGQITGPYIITEDITQRREYRECPGQGGDTIVCDYQPKGLLDYGRNALYRLQINQIRCTLFSSVRIVQFSTGAHYKYKDLSDTFNLKGDGIFAGDGSGGMGANHLRKYPSVRVIFNSKLDLEGESWKGLAPAGPGAYTVSGESVIARCVNYATCWEEPSDLSSLATWNNFIRLKEEHDLNIQVIMCDAEVQDPSTTDLIERNMLIYLDRFFPLNSGVIVYKTYWMRVLNNETIIHRFGLYFHKVSVFMPRTQGSFTSEIYIVAEGRKIPENPAHTELTMATLLTIYNKLKVMRTFEQEFNRALGFTMDTATTGLEDRVPFTRLEEIAVFLTSTGLETGLALKVSEIIAKECHDGLHPYNLMWYLGFILSKKILPITHWFKKGQRMPSSNKIQKLWAGLFGIWFGVCLTMEDEMSFAKITTIYQGPIPLSVYLTQIQSSKSKKTKKSVRNFSMWKICEGKYQKVVDPGARAGITQQMTRLIRVLYRGYSVRRDYSPDDIVKCNSLLKELDKGANVQVLKERSGISFTEIFETIEGGGEIELEQEPEEEEEEPPIIEELD